MRTGSPRSCWRTGTRGFTFGAPEHKLGIKGSPTRELYFDDCAIPGDRLIGAEGEGFRIALRTLDHTRITIAAQALGIAQGALDYALGYVKERTQFGRAVADFQGLQFMIADMAMKLEGGPPAHLRRGGQVGAGHGRREDRRPDLLLLGLQMPGLRRRHVGDHRRGAVAPGHGYVNDYPVERMMRDAKITQIYEGTNQIQRMVMARQLLK